jgi:hypothetical protein
MCGAVSHAGSLSTCIRACYPASRAIPSIEPSHARSRSPLVSFTEAAIVATFASRWRGQIFVQLVWSRLWLRLVESTTGAVAK